MQDPSVRGSGEKQSIMGEAPKLIRILAPVFLAVLVSSLAWPRAFGFLGRFRGGGFALGHPWRIQAVQIDAPADEVWKWLVQVGYKWAGWYNIVAINRLAANNYFIDGKGASWRIVPELQDLQAAGHGRRP